MPLATTRASIALLLLLLVPGCGKKNEGIVLVITGPLEGPITLEIYAGQPMAESVTFRSGGTSDDHLRDQLGDFKAIDLDRNLESESYRYFIRTNNQPNLTLDVAVIAQAASEGEFYAGRAQVSTEPGVVREYEVLLGPATVRNFGEEDKCRAIVLEDGVDFPRDPRFSVSVNDDTDCDGESDSQDCVPDDGRFATTHLDVCDAGISINNDCDDECDEDDPRNEGNIAACGTLIASSECDTGPECESPVPGEICDGRDSDCNPLTQPHGPTTPCFELREGGNVCLFGATDCIDEAAGGTIDPSVCQVDGMTASSVSVEYCDAYISCIQNPPTDSRALDCVYETVRTPVSVCTLEYSTKDGELCDARAQVVANPMNPEVCNVEILDSRLVRGVELSVDEGQQQCEIEFEGLQLGPGIPPSFEVLLSSPADAENGELVRLIVNVQEVEECVSSNINPCGGPIVFENN